MLANFAQLFSAAGKPTVSSSEVSATNTKSHLLGKTFLPCYENPRHFYLPPVAFIIPFLHLSSILCSVSACVHALVDAIVQLAGLKFTLCGRHISFQRFYITQGSKSQNKTFVANII